MKYQNKGLRVLVIYGQLSTSMLGIGLPKVIYIYCQLYSSLNYRIKKWPYRVNQTGDINLIDLLGYSSNKNKND
jgi:hypothetical protein